MPNVIRSVVKSLALKGIALLFIISAQPVLALDIFFVHSYHHQYPWVNEYFTGFKQNLNSHSLIDFQMDTKRLPESAFQQQAQHALDAIRQHRPKIVVVADDNALKLVGRQAANLGYPVVFLGINNNPREYLDVTDRVSGVLERPLFKRSVLALRNIMPRLKRIKVLLEEGITSEAIISASFGGYIRQSVDDIQVDVSKVRDFNHWQALVHAASIQGYDLIILGNYARLPDNNGGTVPTDITTKWTVLNSKIPVFAFWKFSVGADKAVGGLVLAGEFQGKTAASIVNHYLRAGEFSAPMIRIPTQGLYYFSRSEFLRWGFDLPEELEGQIYWVD